MISNQTFAVEYKGTPNSLAESASMMVSTSGFNLKLIQNNAVIHFKFKDIVGIHTYNENNVVINFGIYPYQSITCREEAFLYLLKTHYRDEPLVAELFKTGKSTFMKYMLIMAGIVIGLILLAYFFLLPYLVDKAVTHFPQEYEQKFGKAMFEQVKQSETIDATKTKLLNQFFDSLHYGGHYKVQLLCVKKKEVNAYALPGGFIVVYDEILNNMHTSNELAGLLAHEYAHISLKHTLKSTFNTLGFSVLVQLIFGGFDDSMLALVGSQTEQLRELHYSRSLEQEADAYGFGLMQKQQLDPQGMIQLLERLKEVDSNEVPGILSTHPLPQERIDEVARLMASNKYIIKEAPALNQIFDGLQDAPNAY